jgi:hypothetical protein
LVAPYVLGTKLERRGFEMGILFANVYRDLCSSRDPFPIAHVHERISKLRDENPQLVKIQYWTFLENHLYSDYDAYLHDEYLEIENLKDVDYWLEISEFANSKKFKRFEQGVVEHVIIKIIEIVATGSIDCENGIKYLRSLLPQIRDKMCVGSFNFDMDN